MNVDFASITNYYERIVEAAVLEAAPRFPGIAGSKELLVDVACVALNRLPPRYIRHEADLVFYLSDRDRIEGERQVADAVEHAFGFVQARAAMRARA